MRDQTTGLDYADQRYYAGNMSGRFLTADESGLNEALEVPLSWNRYSFVEGDPSNLTDPEGLACRDRTVSRDGRPIGTIGGIVGQDNDWAILSQALYLETRIVDSDQGRAEKAAVAAVIMNRWQFANGFYTLWTSAARGGSVVPATDWGAPSSSIRPIVFNPSQFGIVELKPDGTVGLKQREQERLDSALNSSDNSVECRSLMDSIATADLYLRETMEGVLWISDNGLIFTGFNSFRPPRNAPYEKSIGSFGSANTFFGVQVDQVRWNYGLQVAPPGRGVDKGVGQPRPRRGQ